jgi:hypothetical protein
MEDNLLDKRVVEHYIREGWITREEYEEHLKNLPDVSVLVEERPAGSDIPSQTRQKKKGDRKGKGSKASSK